MIIMSNIIETLLLRNLQEVFGKGDPERRRSAIEELYTEDCVVNLAVGQYHGHDALDRICGELRACHPSYPPGHSSGGFANAETHYANPDSTGGVHSDNSHVVSQYDVAGFQWALHHPA